MRMSVRACLRTSCLAVVMRMSAAVLTIMRVRRRRESALFPQILAGSHLVIIFIAAAVEVSDKSLTRFLVHVAEQRDVRVLEA